jgi:hypothetical protein
LPPCTVLLEAISADTLAVKLAQFFTIQQSNSVFEYGLYKLKYNEDIPD